ncbi:MAG: PAS domain S-box protein [Blastocatellia bacterium]|nr:PAS domain S-box protein [Blastocatellia bacterium]
MQAQYNTGNANWLAGILMGLGDRIVVLDQSGTVLFSNREAAAVFPELQAGVNLISLWQPNPLDEIQSLLAGIQSVRTGSTDQIEIELCHRAQSQQVWFEARISRFEPGETGFVLLVLREITTRKRQDIQQLSFRQNVQKVATEWYRTFDSILMPIFIVDAAGHLVRLNQSALQLFPFSRFQDAIGHPFTTIATAENSTQLDQLFRQTLVGAGPQKQKITNPLQNKIWEVTTSLCDNRETEDTCVIFVFHDVTQLVHLQESLQENQHLAALGRVISGLAHQVRNPLFAISATLDAFEARFGRQEDARRYVNVLHEEINRVNQLMHELVEFGSPIKLSLVESQLGSVVDKAMIDCQPIATAIGVILEKKVMGVLPKVLIDPDKFTEVFCNLLDNALQYSTPQGHVVVELSQVSSQAQTFVHCRVCDSGPGFPAEDLDRVFDPFYTRRFGKIGLGLASVHRVVTAHGGRISAANAPNQGGVISIWLPVPPSNPN